MTSARSLTPGTPVDSISLLDCLPQSGCVTSETSSNTCYMVLYNFQQVVEIMKHCQILLPGPDFKEIMVSSFLKFGVASDQHKGSTRLLSRQDNRWPGSLSPRMMEIIGKKRVTAGFILLDDSGHQISAQNFLCFHADSETDCIEVVGTDDTCSL